MEASIRPLPLLPDTVSPKLVKRTGSLNHRGQQEQNGDKVSPVEQHGALQICIKGVRACVLLQYVRMYVHMYVRMYTTLSISILLIAEVHMSIFVH